MSSPGRPFEEKILGQECTAEIKIVQHLTKRIANERGYFDAPERTYGQELLEITLCANNVENLKAKIHAHVGLVEGQE